jgi:hypothetical protein
VRLGEREIDVERGLVRTQETEHALTTLQRELLQILVASAGAVVSREVLRQGYRLKVAPSRTNQAGELPALWVSEQTLAEVLRACESPGWVLLTGPPGAGKTSLAQHACRALAERLPGGAWWLDCQGLSEEEEVLAAIRELLGAESLERRPPLALVLDGLELTPLSLGTAPGLRLLCTSSRKLELPGPTWVLPAPAAVSSSSLARCWAGCTLEERQLLGQCARFVGAFGALGSSTVAAVPPSVVQRLVERWLLLPEGGQLRLWAPLRQWMLEQGLVWGPTLAFVRYLAGRPQEAAVDDLSVALQDAIALGCLHEASTLAGVLLERAPAEHRGLRVQIERLSSPEMQLVLARAHVLSGDLQPALEARQRALSGGLSVESWTVRALDCALGPLLSPQVPDPGPQEPRSPAEWMVWARLRGAALGGQEGVRWLRRSHRSALERGDRVAELLAEGEILKALAGASRERSAQEHERLADELVSLGSHDHAVEGWLLAARLWGALGRRERSQALLERCTQLAASGGFGALLRRARIEALALDLADGEPAALLAQIAALRGAADATAEAELDYLQAVAQARAGDELRLGHVPASIARSVALVVAHRRGEPLQDRQALEDVARDPRIRALLAS